MYFFLGDKKKIVFMVLKFVPIGTTNQSHMLQDFFDYKFTIRLNIGNAFWKPPFVKSSFHTWWVRKTRALEILSQKMCPKSMFLGVKDQK
jgi:hypothetical protein